MDETSWVLNHGADKYAIKIPVPACQASVELAKICTCQGLSTEPRCATQSDRMLLKENVSTATHGNIGEESQLHAALDGLRCHSDFADPVTTSISSRPTLSLRNDSEETAKRGMPKTRNTCGKNQENTNSEMGRKSETESLGACRSLGDSVLPSKMNSASLLLKTKGAGSAVGLREVVALSTLTTTIRLMSSEDFSVGGVTKDWACSETLKKLLSEHSSTCALRRFEPKDGYLIRPNYFNWRSAPVCASTYISAIMRHLNKWREREDLDTESGRSHLAHIAANCAILMDAAAHGTLEDDRV